MDSELSASELRQRYHRGGSLNDDELTSAQLRARHAIPSNSKGMMKTTLTYLLTYSTIVYNIACGYNLDFSSAPLNSSSNGSSVFIIAVVIVAAAIVGYILFNK